MKDKYEIDEYVIDEDKFPRNSSLRQENELFDDDSYVPQQIISVKRVEYGKGEDWEIFADDKIVMTIKGVRFSAKERKFLRSVEGIQFLMRGYKAGWKSVSEFKRNLKVQK